MSNTPAATDPIPLPLAAELAGIPARTLRNWVKSGKLAAIRGQRGWLVRTGDIARIAAMIGTDAASVDLAGGMAAGSAADVAASPHQDDQDAANAASAAMVATDQREQAEALVQRLLAPFIAELGAVREELGAVKAERDELRRRAEAAEAQLASRLESDSSRTRDRVPPAGNAPIGMAPPSERRSEDRPGGLRARLGRWWRGEG